MARQSIISSLLALVVMMQTSLTAVRADYLFAVEVSRYQNPSSLKSSGSWCDNTFFWRGWSCDNFFIFCLREQETSSLNSSHCPLGRYITTTVVFDTDIIEFGVGEGALNGLPNPLEFGALAGEWLNGIQLLIVIGDYDGEDRYDLVDAIEVNFTGPAGKNFTDFETYTGRYDNGQIELSFRVQCTNNSYGSDCGIICVERDDDQGHYTCDSEGNKICRDGYQNPQTNCTQCVPAEGCSPLGGYCTSPGTCICYEGFLGVNCSESSDNGTGTGSGSERDQGTSAAIAGGVMGASLFMVAVVCAAIVSILLWRCRNSHSRSKGKGGESAVMPGDNPVYQVEESLTSLPGDNPVYGMKEDSTCAIALTGQPSSQSEAGNRDSTVKKLENPIYGTQWDFANNGHIYATLEPQHICLSQDPDYAIVPDELPPTQQIYDTPPE